MQNENTFFQTTLTALREKKQRLRTIFKKLRRTERFSGLSDFCLLKTIINTLDELKLSYSRQEVRMAFKEVDPEDYETKRMAIKDLAKNAGSGSVFRHQIIERKDKKISVEPFLGQVSYNLPSRVLEALRS